MKGVNAFHALTDVYGLMEPEYEDVELDAETHGQKGKGTVLKFRIKEDYLDVVKKFLPAQYQLSD